VLYCNQVSISFSSHFRGNEPQTFWGHDLDLSWSRDYHWSRDQSIPHRPFPIGCPLAPRLYLLPLFEIFGPKNLCAHRQKDRHTDTRRKSHAMYYNGQTTNKILWAAVHKRTKSAEKPLNAIQCGSGSTKVSVGCHCSTAWFVTYIITNKLKRTGNDISASNCSIWHKTCASGAINPIRKHLTTDPQSDGSIGCIQTYALQLSRNIMPQRQYCGMW